MDRIEIRVRDPQDLTPDVAGLGKHLGEQLGVEIALGLGEPIGRVRDHYQQPFLLYSVVKIILPWAGGYAATKAVDQATAWLKGRWRKQQDEGATLQPREVIIYGPSEEVLSRVNAPAEER
jgi:hypothetical protein